MRGREREIRSEGGSGPRELPGPVLGGYGLVFTYPKAVTPALAAVDAEVRPGRLTAVLGPNGSGKSTLLKLLSGALRPGAGRVLLDGRRLARLEDRKRALTLAVVPQSEASPFPATVREVVLMGRYPHLEPWERTSRQDEAAVERALVRCGVGTLRHRALASLSGGERQRVRMARALAQEASILLLDEPTSGLDLRYRMEVFHLLRDVCADGLGVLLVTHDLNLAARFAHQVVLLDRGRTVGSGPPCAALDRERLEAVYRWPLRLVPHPGPGEDEGAPQAIPLRRASP